MERSAILTMNVDNSSGQGYSEWSTDGGNNTRDQVFLLSYAEANRYLGVTYDNGNNTKSRVAPTAYALAQGASASKSYKTEDDETAGWWWLRSPGYYGSYEAVVYRDGSLRGSIVDIGANVVRPVLWVNLESDIF